MRLKGSVVVAGVACLLLCWPSMAARPMSRYLGFGKVLLVVTNEPKSSPILEMLFTRVPVKNRIVSSVEESGGHLEELERGDVTAIFLINHHRGSVSPELQKEVLERTTFAPLPPLSKNTLLTMCRRRQQNPDLLEVFLAAPDSSRLEKELKRFLNSTESVPFFRKTEVLYCAVIASRPEYAQRFISSRAAIEAQAFNFGEAEAFLQAAGDNSEVYIVDRQDPTPIPEALLERMPLNPFSLRPNEVTLVRADKAGEESIMLYTGPCERFLLPSLGEVPPKVVSLPDLSSAKALGVSDLFAGTAGERDYELVRQSSAVFAEAIFGLCQKKGLAVAERRLFREVAEEMGLHSTGLFDEATVARVGKLVGAQAMVVAEVPTVRRWTDREFSEWRARDGVREKWAWHWSEKVQGRAEVTLNLRLVDVETATLIWNATVSAAQDGEEMEVRSEAKDEPGGGKPPIPHWFRTDYSSPGCPEGLVSGALAEAIARGRERLEQEVLWPTDMLPLAGVSVEGEVVGMVEAVEKETVFVSVEEGMEWLRPGSILYVVEETKVGTDVYRRKKATLVVKVVKTGSAQCTIQSLEAGETIDQFDLVSSRPEAGG